MNIDFETFIPKFNEICDRGLSAGIGDRNGQMCIEAAVCAALDLPHGDDPQCVSASVRGFKIALNDAMWSSPQARAAGLRKLGIAQVGSKGVVGDADFSRRLSEKVIRKLIPAIFRDLFKDNPACLAAADRCEQDGSADAADVAAYAAAYAADVAACAACAAADASDAADAARAATRAATRAAYAACAARAAYATDAAAYADRYLVMVADLALEVLIELGSPGCEYL